MVKLIVLGGLAFAMLVGVVVSLVSSWRSRGVSRRELDRLQGFRLSAGPYVITPTDVSAAWRDVE